MIDLEQARDSIILCPRIWRRLLPRILLVIALLVGLGFVLSLPHSVLHAHVFFYLAWGILALSCVVWDGRVTLRVPLACLLAVIGVLSILPFGNPQWNKSIYMFQCYVFPRNVDDGEYEFLDPPVGYTGIWIDWNEDGTKFREMRLKNGQHHGEVKYWLSPGKLRQQAFYRNGVPQGTHRTWAQDGQKTAEYGFDDNGKLHGLYTQWWENGKKAKETTYRQDFEHGKQTIWDANGKVTSIKWYLHGKEVTEEEFRKAEAQEKKTPVTQKNGDKKDR